MERMEYIEKEQDVIYKYEILFNKDELNKLKEKIFDETAIREKRALDTVGPISERWINKPNYKVNVLKYIEKDNKIHSDLIPLFHIEFDEVMYQSPLVNIIDRILKNDSDGFKNLKIYEETIKDEIRNNESCIDNNFDTISSIAKIKNFNELKRIYDNLSIIVNENKKLIKEKEYISDINHLFTINKIDSIDEETYRHALTFKKMAK